MLKNSGVFYFKSAISFSNIDENCSGRRNNVRILFAHVSTVMYEHQISMVFVQPAHVSLGIQGILLDSTINDDTTQRVP